VDALDVMKVCLRRWDVMLPVLAITVAAGWGLLQARAPTYLASGSFALVYDHGEDLQVNQTDPRNANPLSGDDASLLGEALVSRFMSAEFQRSVPAGTSGVAPGQPHNGSRFTVGQPESSKSFLVQAWGPDQGRVEQVVAQVLDAGPDEARTIQERAGAPTESQFSTFTIGSAQVEELPQTSFVKLLVAIIGVGLLAGSALSVLVDGLLRRRRRRREDTYQGPPAGPGGMPVASMPTAPTTPPRLDVRRPAS